MKTYRLVIAINETTGQRVDFSGTYSAARELGSSCAAITISLATGTAVKGWKLYDAPARIRERIKELEAQLVMLEG